MKEKEMLDKLILDNKTLSIKIQTLENKLEEYKGKLAILNRMTDEWAKSYDNLLKDFISYRDRTRV